MFGLKFPFRETHSLETSQLCHNCRNRVSKAKLLIGFNTNSKTKQTSGQQGFHIENLLFQTGLCKTHFAKWKILHNWLDERWAKNVTQLLIQEFFTLSVEKCFSYLPIQPKFQLRNVFSTCQFSQNFSWEMFILPANSASRPPRCLHRCWAWLQFWGKQCSFSNQLVCPISLKLYLWILKELVAAGRHLGPRAVGWDG